MCGRGQTSSDFILAMNHQQVAQVEANEGLRKGVGARGERMGARWGLWENAGGCKVGMSQGQGGLANSWPAKLEKRPRKLEICLCFQLVWTAKGSLSTSSSGKPPTPTWCALEAEQSFLTVKGDLLTNGLRSRCRPARSRPPRDTGAPVSSCSASSGVAVALT